MNYLNFLYFSILGAVLDTGRKRNQITFFVFVLSNSMLFVWIVLHWMNAKRKIYIILHLKIKIFCWVISLYKLKGMEKSLIKSLNVLKACFMAVYGFPHFWNNLY